MSDNVASTNLHTSSPIAPTSLAPSMLSRLTSQPLAPQANSTSLGVPAHSNPTSLSRSPLAATTTRIRTELTSATPQGWGQEQALLAPAWSDETFRRAVACLGVIQVAIQGGEGTLAT